MIKKEINDKAVICGLIPHAGLMCLLDKVAEYDDKQIICYSNTHRNADNPLRNQDGLPVTALIEYGAQAMAVHGGLMAKESGRVIQEGYLAALRDVEFECEDVSKIDCLLQIEAEQLMASQGNMIYNFSIKVDKRILIRGRATVVARYTD